MTPEQGQRALLLFDELIELDVEARALRLADLADVELARTLARMLAADDAAGVFDGDVAQAMPIYDEVLSTALEGEG